MLYIYKDGDGEYNAICDGRLKNRVNTKIRKDRFGNDSEYSIFDIIYNYDKRTQQYRVIKCVCLANPAVRVLKYLHPNDKVLLFGTIILDKRRSTACDEKKYTLIVSSFLHMNEIYSLIAKAHEKDDLEARIMAQYKKKQRKANEINLVGEAERIVSQDDVLL